MSNLLLTGLFLVTSAAFAQDETIPVSVATVQSASTYDEIKLSGSLAPWRKTQLSPRTEGYITHLNVSEGDTVEPEDIILELDPTLVEISLTRAKAELSEGEVRYREAIRQLKEFERLVGKKAVADSDVEKAESDVALYGAGVERLKAALNREQEMLARHTVTAPFGGVVSEKMIEVGSWIETSTKLVTLIETHRLKAEVPVPQEHYAYITEGTPAIVEFDAVPDYSYEGKVNKRIPVSDSTTRNFIVQIEVDNALGLLAPGMSARVRLQANHTENALILPRDAVVRNEDGSESVWKIRKQDGITSGVHVQIKTGRKLGDWVEVEGDLGAGDQVVVHGNESLNPEQNLEVTEEIQPAQG